MHARRTALNFATHGVGLALHAVRPLLLGAQVRVWELLFAGLLGTLLYAFLLVAPRELTRADLQVDSDALHPGRMVEYVRDEVRDKRRPSAPSIQRNR